LLESIEHQKFAPSLSHVWVWRLSLQTKWPNMHQNFVKIFIVRIDRASKVCSSALSRLGYGGLNYKLNGQICIKKSLKFLMLGSIEHQKLAPALSYFWV